MATTSFRSAPHGTASPAAAVTVRRASEPPPPATDAHLVAEVRHEIHGLVAEITRLAGEDVEPARFFEGFLTRVITAMAAVGGAVWTRSAQGQPQLQTQVSLEAAGLESAEATTGAHGQLLRSVMAQGQPAVVPPGDALGTPSAGKNNTAHIIVLAPVMVDRECTGVIEILQRTGGTPAAQRGYVRFLSQMADLAAGYLKSRRLQQLEETQLLWRELESFVDAIHQSLDVRETSFAVVNDGRRLVGCDRLSLVLGYGGTCRVEAVSGLDSIDRRAGEAQTLTKLAGAVLKTGEALWWDGSPGELPAQISEPLDAHLDRSHARLLAVLPLIPRSTPTASGSDAPAHDGRKALGALVLEQFGPGHDAAALRQRATIAAQHSARALAASIEHSSVFLLPLWRAIGQAAWLVRGAALPKTLTALIALAAMGYALVAVQTDFQIAARGKLQPAERREVFAPLDGVVARVPVEHGQRVEAGTVLAELASTELDLQLAALVGRQTTNQERLAALSRALLDNKGGAARLAPAEESRLAGEMLELRQEAANIEQEFRLLKQKQQQLRIAAPLRGQVVTWKVHDLLLQRPVIRGQALMKLANPDGPWELELYLPERRLAHVQRAGEEPLLVSFVMSSHPGQTFTGRVAEIDRTAEMREGDGNTILVRVALDKDQLPPLHDQTSVTAKLHCGRTSVGYAWFCDLIETVQSKVLFWLPS